MAWGIVIDVPAPIEFYDALHAEIGRREKDVEGLLVHLGRPTATGFQVLGIWASKAQYERYDAEVIKPALAELSGGAPPAEPPRTEEFEVHGLVIPQVPSSERVLGN
jgi:hypothetical protein